MSDSLLEALQALEAGSERACPAVEVASKLDPEAGEYVLKLLKNPSISIRSIHNILQQQKFSIARESLANHRKGDCRCDDE